VISGGRVDPGQRNAPRGDVALQHGMPTQGELEAVARHTYTSESRMHTAAVLCTIIAGAKRHGLEPWAYLHDVILQGSGDANPESIAGLLPDRWALVQLEGVLTHRLEESRQRRSVGVNGGRVDRST
jgi:hypothetical protein